MNSDLLRQRRNLMIVSVGLLLFDFANVTIAKVSILGTELLIGNATVLVYCAWFLWLYFLLRYYQFIRAESDLGISSSYKSLFEAKARAYVFQKINKTYLNGNIDFRRKGLRSEYSVMEYKPDLSATHETDAGILPPLKIAWWIASSWFYIAAHTPKLTDHVLPFFLALTALVAGLIRFA